MSEDTMVNWKKIREQFPATKKYTYINAAEGSPVSKLAAKEGKRFYDEILADGDLPWENWLKRTEEIRETVAKFINADKNEIAFTLNTSHGMNLIAEILKGKGEVITMDDEFPSSTFPWLNRRYKVRFVKPKNAIYSIEDIKKKINKKTKIIVTSYVQYCTGFRQDLAELGKLCRQKGLIFVVNATQAMGAMPIDVKKANIDFLVFTSLKWPMAGYGAGVLYMNKKWFNKIQYPVAGWQSVKNPNLMNNKKLNLQKDASELEVGCPHFPNIFALGGALDLLNKIGKKNIQKRIFELNDYLVKKLKELNIEIVSPLAKKYRSGITIVKLKNAKELVPKLFKKNIVVSARKKGLRVSMHIYNNKKDIDHFVSELKKILGS
ncbi:aminotransferase class V-fold PLP-dependent enzyme [Candidatus Woesearchaeota archaeon]|nr:aminotransferase class V-fold PLP-dependent enzyme [Candidatus Woesearchaeota archaeon]